MSSLGASVGFVLDRLEEDFGNKRLVRVKTNIHDNDCVTKHQTIKLDGFNFHGKKKQLTYILPETLPSDVAVVDRILKYEASLLKQGDIKYASLKHKENKWVAKKQQVGNLVWVWIVVIPCVPLKLPQSNTGEWNLNYNG